MKEFMCLFSVDSMNLQGETVTEYGILQANDFRDAVNQLEGELYGNEIVKINEIELFDSLPILSQEVYNTLRDYFAKGTDL